ncbi:hypothetical protein QBC38DRAFT_52888 [Podospora fimiseda]|uniref:Serine protease n=1 Tax=Podospora fimiseda TaxID=252190 RepID=A0AAN7GUH0_9PEZI|nr:hypothetical protein QBC38DRAFT_52888 [Podospora fimiseda]
MDPQPITIADVLLTESCDQHFPGLRAITLSYQVFLGCLLSRVGLKGVFSFDQFDAALQIRGYRVRDVVEAMRGIQSAITRVCGGIEVFDGVSLKTWKDFAFTWQGAEGLQYDPIPSILAVIDGKPFCSELKILCAKIDVERVAANRRYIAQCLRYLKSCAPGSTGTLPPCELPNHLIGVINDFPDLIFWTLNRGFGQCPDSCPERLLGIYSRHAVPEDYYRPPDGRFSGIVKLELDFGGSRPYRGTGWLIDHNTIVTSAHNVVFNGQARMGEGKHLFSLKATAGETPNEQTLTGMAVAASWAWYHMSVGTHDLAVIRVHGSFNARPLNWTNTPVSVQGSVTDDLELVGFPGDKDGMYYSGADMHADICAESSKMVAFHRGETVAGSSGSPILRKSDSHVIVVHRGGVDSDFNEGVILDAKSNNILEYRRVLDHAISAHNGTNSDIRQVSRETIQGATPGGSLTVTRYQVLSPMGYFETPAQESNDVKPTGPRAGAPAFTHPEPETNENGMADTHYHDLTAMETSATLGPIRKPARPAKRDSDIEDLRMSRGNPRTKFRLFSGSLLSTFIGIFLFSILSFFDIPVVLPSVWCSFFTTPWICFP